MRGERSGFKKDCVYFCPESQVCRTRSDGEGGRCQGAAVLFLGPDLSGLKSTRAHRVVGAAPSHWDSTFAQSLGRRVRCWGGISTVLHGSLLRQVLIILSFQYHGRSRAQETDREWAWRCTSHTPARQPNPGESAQAPFPLAPRRGRGAGRGAQGNWPTTWSLIGPASHLYGVHSWRPRRVCDPPCRVAAAVHLCIRPTPGALGLHPVTPGGGPAAACHQPKLKSTHVQGTGELILGGGERERENAGMPASPGSGILCWTWLRMYSRISS